jgi:hypothetical protein
MAGPMGPGYSVDSGLGPLTQWMANAIGGVLRRGGVTPTVTSTPTVAPPFTPMPVPQYGPTVSRTTTPTYRRGGLEEGTGIPTAPTSPWIAQPKLGAGVSKYSPQRAAYIAQNQADVAPTTDEALAALWEQYMNAAGLGGADNSLGWANLDLQREQMAQQAAQYAQSMAQAAEIERQRREQQQREMAAAMGQAIAQMQSQNWQTGLPWRLPSDTQYAPGFEPGGAANRLAQMAQAAYNAPRIVPSNPPSREDMESWLEEAMKRFGPQ